MPHTISSVPIKSRAELANTGRGILTETFPLHLASTGLTPATQTVYASLIGLRAGDVVTNIVVDTLTAGTSTAPTGIFVGLYDKTGLSLAISSNLSASGNWTATGPHNCAVTAPYAVTADDSYFAVFLENGTWGGTALQVGSWSGAVAGNAKALGSGLQLYATFGTGQTALTTVGQTAPAIATIGQAPWLAVS